jgi:predicted AAA+ superfamily ATPase
MAECPHQVVILGSSTVLVQQGLSESLAGRFEVIPVTHWSFTEMKEAFGWSVDQYIFYGGYPDAAEVITDTEPWSRYSMDSLIETTISRDILLMNRVDKPALLRRFFELGCAYSGHVLSYQKMLGQLQDAGNTTTLAHYPTLLESAGMLIGLSKYAGQKVRRRASSPKLLVLNTALVTAQSQHTFEKAKETPNSGVACSNRPSERHW